MLQLHQLLQPILRIDISLEAGHLLALTQDRDPGGLLDALTRQCFDSYLLHISPSWTSSRCSSCRCRRPLRRGIRLRTGRLCMAFETVGLPLWRYSLVQLWDRSSRLSSLVPQHCDSTCNTMRASTLKHTLI